MINAEFASSDMSKNAGPLSLDSHTAMVKAFQCCNIEKIDFSYSLIPDDHINLVLNTIFSQKKLNHLDISGSSLDVPKTAHLFLEKLSNLRVLKLQEITCNNVYKDCDKFSKALEDHNSLEVLSLKTESVYEYAWLERLKQISNEKKIIIDIGNPLKYLKENVKGYKDMLSYANKILQNNIDVKNSNNILTMLNTYKTKSLEKNSKIKSTKVSSTKVRDAKIKSTKVSGTKVRGAKIKTTKISSNSKNKRKLGQIYRSPPASNSKKIVLSNRKGNHYR